MSDWNDVKHIQTREWQCGFCGREVASNRGWNATNFSGHSGQETVTAYVAICPRCDVPSIIGAGPNGASIPASKFGERVIDLPDDIATLYEEARHAVTSGAPNSAALSCRKILMHVGVEKGADIGQNFISYVNYLSENGYVPPDAREWIDEIREHGNDANHEIVLITEDEAKDMVEFTAMLLRVVYEYPARGRRAKQARESKRP